MTTPLARLPRGARLTDDSWTARHRVVVRLLWGHVPALLLVGLAGPAPLFETVLLTALIAATAACTSLPRTRSGRSTVASLGLIMSTFVFIELSGGRVDSHLHLYAILVFVALYQRWAPLVWALVFVVVHHATVGILAPARVFGMMVDHHEALVMVAIHSGAVVLEVAGILIFWHFAEQAEREGERLAEEAALALRERDEADRAAKAREVEAEQERAARAVQESARTARHAAEVAEGARAAIDAVAAVDRELSGLAAAVQDIARRSTQAAGIAATGREVADDATERMTGLQTSVSEIAEVNSLIAQLAGQTNLLSLNATIEAARAGEMGKGFAVVASEVKQLANETATSASRVNGVIGAITGQTEAAAGGFASTTSAVNEISEVQVAIAASVEEQASVLAEIARQVSTASTAGKEVLAGLDRLIADARRSA
ncbi:methyl-accepting chemotaxis protein [Actinoplanes sp. NPDC051633]|uniref:methyl-accepting chemotaxis protein n=1 Tax=Actinoplanes sp. NPDC051633 TaxID=3155670 RepID=UPI0034251C41